MNSFVLLAQESLFHDFFGRLYRAFIANNGWKEMLRGLEATFYISIGALILGMVLGALVAVVKVTPGKGILKRILNIVADVYITVIRGTPVMVQLMLMYFGVFAATGMDAILVATLVFGVNSGAYVAEVFRSGIQAVDRGQTEAGRSLGLSYGKTMWKIVLPQAVKNILPALGNEFIALIKETSVAGFVTVFDLTRAARAIVSQTYDPFVPYLVLAAVYLVLVMIASGLVKLLERRLNRSDRG